MSDFYNNIQEACKIIISAASDLDSENDKYKSLFNLKAGMYRTVSEENAKLKRLLAEACEMLCKTTGVLCSFGYLKKDDSHKPTELEQWFEEHKKHE